MASFVGEVVVVVAPVVVILMDVLVAKCSLFGTSLAGVPRLGKTKLVLWVRGVSLSLVLDFTIVGIVAVKGGWILAIGLSHILVKGVVFLLVVLVTIVTLSQAPFAGLVGLGESKNTMGFVPKCVCSLTRAGLIIVFISVLMVVMRVLVCIRMIRIVI